MYGLTSLNQQGLGLSDWSKKKPIQLLLTFSNDFLKVLMLGASTS